MATTVGYTDAWMRRPPYSSSFVQGAAPAVLDYTTTAGASKSPVSTPVAPIAQPVQQAPQQQQGYDIQGMIRNGINSQSALYDQGQRDLEGSVGNLYNTQVAGINAQRDQSLAKFPGYQQEVQSNQKRTLQDLAGDVRNSFTAANNYLGARGASNSSAANMYAYALQGEANKNRANVQVEYGKQFKQLQDQQIEVQNQATNAVNEADTWLGNKKSEIAQQYSQMKQQLQALGMNMSIQDAQKFNDDLRRLEDQANGYKQQVLGGYQSRIEALNNAKLQMSNSSNFNPTQVAQGELASTMQFAPTAQDYAYSFFPQAKKSNLAFQ